MKTMLYYFFGFLVIKAAVISALIYYFSKNKKYTLNDYKCMVKNKLSRLKTSVTKLAASKISHQE